MIKEDIQRYLEASQSCTHAVLELTSSLMDLRFSHSVLYGEKQSVLDVLKHVERHPAVHVIMEAVRESDPTNAKDLELHFIHQKVKDQKGFENFKKVCSLGGGEERILPKYPISSLIKTLEITPGGALSEEEKELLQQDFLGLHCVCISLHSKMLFQYVESMKKQQESNNEVRSFEDALNKLFGK